MTEERTCYYCDEPAGYSDLAGADLGDLREYNGGTTKEWLHVDCHDEMLRNPGRVNVTWQLLEHYLRATGWARDERGWWRRNGRQIGTFGGMSDHEIDLQVRRIADEERVTRADLAARLGLCAGAEDLRLDADRYEPSSTDAQGPREALVTASRRLLRMAGVDPNHWEATQ
jgi:hypothetical protein